MGDFETDCTPVDAIYTATILFVSLSVVQKIRVLLTIPCVSMGNASELHGTAYKMHKQPPKV